MKRLTASFIFAAVAALLPAQAMAQSACSYIVYGAVLTAAQWNSCFQAKQDLIGYVPLNVAGGTMSGKLTTAVPNSATAMFRLPQGSAPTSPLDGDTWMTSSGLYYRANGTTFGPLISAISIAAAAPSAPITYQFWVDTAASTVPFKQYDGSQWVTTGVLDPASHTWDNRGTINGNTITTGSGILTLGAGKTITASNTLTFTGTDGSSVNFGTGGTVSYTASSVASITGTANQISASASTGAVTLSLPSTLIAPGTFQVTGHTTFEGVTSTGATGTGNIVYSASPALTTPNLGTPSAVTLTNGTGLPIASGVSGLGAGVATFLATPSSANLRSALTDESGTGAALFQNGALGDATATTINKLTFTAPATSATLTIANGKTLTASNTLTFSGTDSSSVAFGTGGTVGAVGYSATGQIAATATNDDAAAGKVGEYISSTVTSGSAISLTSTVVANITSISLTAGDWDIRACSAFTGGATTTVNYTMGSISTTSATLNNEPGFFANQVPAGGTSFGTSGQIQFCIGPSRVSLSGSTTYYLVARCSFAVDACSGYGVISARRVR